MFESVKCELQTGNDRRRICVCRFCALAFLALQVSGLNVSAHQQKTYKIVARFSNASGLSERAKVSVAGVVVGRVAHIGLDPIDNRAKSK